ncbi:L,D-transpeptidase family protein [Paracoccus aestuariivivens]|uniref:L,D-transpeptidase family protein n=1 Tax=Paracoccus aestuariivivens TaxID=1820333 RepID=A0A6L6JA90_9RHOB|nr:L,D-transpeptidase [Paracoccus aestuariivivens]MTH78920.1 L,D-transpeptidase family protein [Paracoccus aestuariivivens]
MLPRGSFCGAIQRLSLASVAMLAGFASASAEANPHPRPPSRAASVSATLPAQTAAVPEATETAIGTTPSTSSGKKALRAVSPAEIETAIYNGGDLPAGQSALTAKIQILLDRSGVSPGVVDGWRGGMSESALKAFQRREGLPMTGRMSLEVWELLHAYANDPLTSEYTITDADASGLVDGIPADYAEKAAMESQGYTSVIERLGERFHMDEKFLALLNPGIRFAPGTTISVTKPAKPIRATVTRIIIDKETRRVAAYDVRGNMVADYPATVGSSDTPSPHGTHLVRSVALNPTYTYNPKRNFQQGKNDRVLIVPPGPNGPVGDVWIDLSEPTYGIHGTATPSRLFVNQSHGCVRLTNWDARELAHMVKANVTTVEFLDAGVRIEDVAHSAPSTTSAPISIRASRPPTRSTSLTTRVTDTPAVAPAEPVRSPANAAAITAAVQEAAATVASKVVGSARPLAAPANRSEPLTEALARAEAIADQMLSQRAQDAQQGGHDAKVGSTTLPPPTQTKPQL